MAGKRVPQHVRVQVLAQLAGTSGLHAQLNGPWAEPSALLADEYGAVLRATASAQGQPLFQRLAGLAADRQHAGLAALAVHLHQAARQVELLQVEAGQLRQAQAGGVEQLEHGLVAAGEKFILDCAFQQLQGAVGVEGLGQAPLALGCRQAVGRIVAAVAFAVEVAVEATHCREQAGEAA
ncbi:hypothetical protein D9M71_444330 [compost metagenome]